MSARNSSIRRDIRPSGQAHTKSKQRSRCRFRLKSPKDKATGLQMVKVVELAPIGARVTLRQTMINIASKDVAYCLWDRTMTGASYGFFELNPKSRFPARWSMRLGESGTYSYDGETPASPRVKIVDDLLVTVPGKKMEKVAADNVAGWIAGFREGWLYVKRFSRLRRR